MKVVLGRFGGRAEKISLKLGEIQVLFFIFFIFLFFLLIFWSISWLGADKIHFLAFLFFG